MSLDRRRTLVWVAFLAVVCATATAADPAVAEDYVAEIEAFRADREERLRSPTGWLTLAGLHWLEDGENRFGNDPEHPVPLAADGVPAIAGALVLNDGVVELRAADGVRIEIEGEPVTQRALRDDNSEGGPDIVKLGRLQFHVIRRGERFGVRVKDPEYPRRAGFRGLEYFPIDPGMHLEAELKPYDEPERIQVVSAAGTTAEMLVPGTVEFTLGDRQLSLLPLVSTPDETELWFIFRDRTSGKETYGFRYLYADLADGRVDLDFNRTYNPPCAFSPYATCPMPPRANRLDARIEAGERAYDHP